MSKLGEMIKRLCPNGVEYKKLGEIVKPIATIRWKENLSKKFKYVDLASVDIERHIITRASIIDEKSAPSRAQQIIQARDVLLATTRPMLKRYCKVPDEFNGQICSTGFCVLRANDEIVLPGWIEHIISTTEFFAYVEKHQKGASYPAISNSEVLNYPIPLPPLAIQSEIVKILDNFAELTAELTAELEKRKKQYEHYRDMLLNFEWGGGKL